MAFRTLENTSQKFGRYYILKVETSTGEIITIKYPFTNQFSVERSNLASVNTATFTIFNLNETTRMKLFKDPFDQTAFRLASFSCGYKNDDTYIVPEIFRGSIKQCYSERSGPDFKTIIECFDGQQAMTNGFVSNTLPAGASVKDQVTDLVKQMPNLSGGLVTTGSTDQNKRGVVQFGNPAELVKQLTSTDFYIDKLDGYSIDQSDVFIGEIQEINSESGVLDVPKKTQTSLTMSILFEPRLLVSQLIKVETENGKIYNGSYKITGISHQGVVSGAVGGDYRTTITMLSLGGSVPVYRVINQDNKFRIDTSIAGAL